jgi:hypothetical protein
MAEPNEIADSGNSAAPQTSSEPPIVASPPLSPGEKLSEPVLDAQLKPATFATIDPIQAKPAAKPLPKAPRLVMPQIKITEMKLPPMPSKFGLSRRMRHRAALAAIVMFAAGFGAAVGAIANRPPQKPAPKPDTALLEENYALQRSVAKLAKDITTLKTTVESSARDGRTQLAKLGDRIERVERAPEVTGSIAKPATASAGTPPAQPPAIDKPDVIASPPLPTPRPSIVQASIVPGWILREARNGQAVVETRGELFQVAPGVPLPGLGRVEAVRREGNTWVVVTQKGLIMPGDSTAAIPQRPMYPPYYRRY